MSFVAIPDLEPSSIKIEIPDNLLNHEEFERLLPEALMDIALEARNFWESEAGRRLTSSRLKYQEAIGLEQETSSTVTVKLTSSFAVAVETGSPAFSLRDGFMKSSKLKPGPVKIPAAVAASFIKTGQPAAKKWMIVPLNGNKQVVFSKPTSFRVFTDTQPQTKWQHPGFKGVQIAPDVAFEIADKILPERLEKLIDDVMNKV